MSINLNSRMKSFSLSLGDPLFILKQVNFQPLDRFGQPIAAPLDSGGDPLAGAVSYDPVTGAITVTVTKPGGIITSYTYADSFDPSGVRAVNGLFNNLNPDQQHFGETASPFIRTTGTYYGSYLSQYQPATGEADSAAHPFASALDPTLHNFGVNIVSATPDYMISQDGGTGAPIVANVVDYTPRMISQTIASQAALDASGIATGVDSFNSTSFIVNQATGLGDPAYSGWFVLFGQFFDHGLDFIDKGGNIDAATGKSSKIIIPFAESDPLYDIAPGHQFTLGRATVSGFDADGNPQYLNNTSPFIDQSQTYGSRSEITTLLREWVEDPNHPGTFIPGMHLLDGHSLAQTWTRWDGQATDQTLPTLTELRVAVHETRNAALDRTDITYADTINYHGSGEPLLLDVKPTTATIDTSSDLNIFGDGPNLLKGVDLNTLLLLAPENPADPNSLILVLGVKPGADATLANEAMLQALGGHYIAGDGRVNENFGLTSIHHVFHEEHNFQIDNLIGAIEGARAAGAYTVEQVHGWQTAVNGPGGVPLTDALGNYLDTAGNISWDQNRMFEAAKLINEMEYQHIAIDQYARFVTPDLPDFEAYNDTKDASLALEYSQAAFRYGHSQLRETIDTIDPSGGITAKITQYALASAFLRPDKFAAVGPGAIALGMSHQAGNETDEFVTAALQQSLLGQPMDLPAINIARGRDIGLPTLNEARAAIHAAAQNGEFPLSGYLAPYTSWADFGANMIHPSSLVNFIAAYSFDGDVAAATAAMNDADFMNGGDQGFQKIDLWMGGLAELHVDGGVLGSTFNAIFVEQIERTMDGDRFYYIGRLDSALLQTTNLGNQLFTEQFKDLVERTTGVTHLTGDIFIHEDSYLELGDTPTALELSARGAAADAHKYGDLVLVQHVGVYSDAGDSEAANGSTVIVDGVSYILDVRPDGALGPDGVAPLAGFNAHEVVAGTNLDDLINGGGGVDTVYGDDGDDILFGGDGGDHVYGGIGDDVIDGGEGEDLLDGLAGDDILYAGAGTVDGDVMLGGDGDDQLYGAGGDDEMFGNADDDIVSGGDGNDLIYGDAGTDLLTGGAGDDTLDGGPGDDTAAFSGVAADYLISFDTATGRFTIADQRTDAPDGVDTTIDVEHFAFADGAVATTRYLPSTFSIASLVSQTSESNAGSKAFTFTVTRANGEALAASVDFAVSAGQGVTGADFVGGAIPHGVVHFAAGQTSATLTINIAGDKAVEANEGFTVGLSGPAGSVDPLHAAASGTILDDDSRATAGNETINATAASHYLVGLGGSDTFLMQKQYFGAASATLPSSGLYNYIADFQGAGGWQPVNNDTIAITGFAASATLHLGGVSATDPKEFDYYVEETGQKYWFALHSENGKALNTSQDIFLWHP